MRTKEKIDDPIRTTVVMPRELMTILEHIGQTYNKSRWEVFRRALNVVEAELRDELVAARMEEIKILTERIEKLKEDISKC